MSVCTFCNGEIIILTVRCEFCDYIDYLCETCSKNRTNCGSFNDNGIFVKSGQYLKGDHYFPCGRCEYTKNYDNEIDDNDEIVNEISDKPEI